MAAINRPGYFAMVQILKPNVASLFTLSVMAESSNSSLVVAKEHPNLCYLLSSCSRLVYQTFYHTE